MYDPQGNIPGAGINYFALKMNENFNPEKYFSVSDSIPESLKTQLMMIAFGPLARIASTIENCPFIEKEDVKIYYPEDCTCCICFEKMEGEKKQVYIDPCNHAFFCRECIQLQMNHDLKVCPLCRCPIKEVVDLY